MKSLENLLKTLIASIFFLIPILFSKFNLTSTFELPKLSYLYAATTLIALCWWILIIQNKKMELPKSLLSGLLLFYVLVISASTFFSSNVPLSVWGKLDMPMGALFPTLTLVFISFAILTFFREEKNFTLVIKVFLAAHFIVAFYAIIQRLDLDPINWWGNKQALDRSISTIGQANGLAAFLGAGFPLLIFANNITEKKSLKLLIYFHSLIGAVAFMCGASRSGILALVVSLGLFFVILKPNLKKLFPLILASILGFSTYFTLGRSTLIDKSIPSALQSGLAARSYVWSGAIEMWKDHPLLGVGPENFGDLFYLYSPVERNMAESWEQVWTKAHNEYIQILATTGIIGLVSYLSIFLFIFYFVFIKRKTQSKDQLAELLLFSTLIVLITNLVGFSFAPTSLIIFLFPIMAYSWARLSENKNESIVINLNFSKVMNFSAIALAITLAFFTLESNLKFYIADIYRGQAMYALFNDHNLDEAYDQINKAIQNYSEEAEFWYLKAKIEAAMALASHDRGNMNQAELYKLRATKSSDKSVQINPHREDLWRVRAFCFADLARIDKSVASIVNYSMLRAIDLNPNGPLNYLYLGRMYLNQGLLGPAIEQFRYSIQLKDDFDEPRSELIISLYRAQQTTQAQNEVAEFIKRKPRVNVSDYLMNTIAKIDKDDYAVKLLTEYKNTLESK